MKLKTRLAVAFMIITIVPMILIFVSFFAINDHQARSFTKEYGLTEPVSYTHLDYGSAPKGLMYGLWSMDSLSLIHI